MQGFSGGGQPEGKICRRRPKHRWKDYIKIYLREILWEGVGWIELPQDREKWPACVNMVVNLQVP